MKSSDKGFLWIVGGVAVVFGLLFWATDLRQGIFSAAPARPVAGKVFELTADNLAATRRNAPVLVAFFTTRGDAAGARMARSLDSLAQRVRGQAIVAIANLDDEPDLAQKAGVGKLPAWVIYSGGTEVSRAEGENADLSVDRLIAEQTGASL